MVAYHWDFKLEQFYWVHTIWFTNYKFTVSKDFLLFFERIETNVKFLQIYTNENFWSKTIVLPFVKRVAPIKWRQNINLQHMNILH